MRTSKELAQNGRGVKRAARRSGEFLSCLAARIRALCASKELAQNGPGVKRAVRRPSEVLSCLAARIRTLCALKELAENRHVRERPDPRAGEFLACFAARMRALCALLVCFLLAAACLAQDPRPTSEEQAAMLAAMARYTENYVGSLPNFLCELTTEQYLSGAKHEKWKQGDTLVAQLTYSNGKEKRLLQAVNNKPVKAPATRWRRPLTTEGEFGAILVDVFADSTNAKFDWNRWDTLQGKKVAVFDYAVDKQHSLLKLSRSDLATALVAYHGSVFGDPETGAILRVTNQADDIPPEIQIRMIATTVDYEETRIGSSTYLLPSHASVIDNAATALIRNELFFRNYRKFEAESTIKFGDEAAPEPPH